MKKKGILFALAGGTFWGFSGACSQFLFSHYTISSIKLTSIRMVYTGIILVLFGLITQKDKMTAVFKNKRDIGHLILFAIGGLSFSQFTYLTAISYSNAGTATVLQYLYPLYIMLLVCITTHRLPQKIEAISIILALGGVFILATHGNIHSMALTPKGLLWGLLSSVAGASYTLLPEKLMKRYGSIPITGFGMLIGGIVITLGFQTYKEVLHLDMAGYLALMGIVVLGTLFAYTFYLTGVALAGPVITSMLASVEPVSAALFAFFWLKTPFIWMDLIGFAMIITMVCLLTIKKT